MSVSNKYSSLSKSRSKYSRYDTKKGHGLGQILLFYQFLIRQILKQSRENNSKNYLKLLLAKIEKISLKYLHMIL